MAEYIEREAIIKHIEEKLDKLTDMPEMGVRIAAMESAYNSTLNYIMQIPAVDVEPVVRCKDCKLYSGKYCALTDDTEDRREPNDFCSCGERKCRNDTRRSFGDD